ncbi:Peptidase S54 rhomboid domain [Arabidopsis suecica]|uniref:Peptidase S54 rhomboid domain n=1 Tax=Arabidopsis suecica TaxID=45249 RepID=A0A8T1ZBY1_ARASU|nr:Peptidase S54 rhomboid domain [Arabidopsis suecica]
MSQLHLHLQLHRHYLSLPHSSTLCSRLPSLHCRLVASSPTNSRLSINSTNSIVFRPLTVVRSRSSETNITPQFELEKPKKQANGIFLIILINLAIFMAQHFFQVRGIKSMYLYSDFPAWYQFVTATFCHANWNHLSSNLFLLYIFGKIVEEEKGNFGLWLSYLFTGVGANLVSWFTLPPNSVSAGASGAVFGLFLISVRVKMSPGWRKFLEVLILGQFVMKRVFEAAQTSTGLLETKFCGYIFGGNEFLTIIQTVRPVAQFSGALLGVLLVWLLSKFLSEPVDQEVIQSLQK